MTNARRSPTACNGIDAVALAVASCVGSRRGVDDLTGRDCLADGVRNSYIPHAIGIFNTI